MISRLQLLCAVVSVSLALSGCATQLANPSVSEQEVDEERVEQMALVVQRYLERQTRLDRVASKVSVAGAELCGDDLDYAFGISWASAEALSEPYRQVASRVGLDGGMQIWDTVPGFDASLAKIRRGTSVAAVNGMPVEGFPSLAKAIDPSWQSGRLRLELRDGPDTAIRDLTLRGKRACRYLVLVAQEDSVNAFADGNRVFVTQGMMRFAASDDDLALVVGHEIAHNSLGHVREKKVTSRVSRGTGTLLDVAAGVLGIPTFGGFRALAGAASDAATRRRSRDFESDADYMGLYMARRAGYDVSQAHLFWREMAAEYPASIKGGMMATHPSTPERSAALRSGIAEILDKEMTGHPLFPEGLVPDPADQD